MLRFVEDRQIEIGEVDQFGVERACFAAKS